MSLLKVIFLCIALYISPHSTNSFPDAPEYVTSECRDKAKTFRISKGMSLPLAYDSAQVCMYQNLQVLENMTLLDLALTTPHTGRSICRIQVHWFNKTAKRVNMTISDTDLLGNCVHRNTTNIVEALEDPRTKQLSELRIPRKMGMTRIYYEEYNARLLFTDYKTCLIFITALYYAKVKYCELFVVSANVFNIHNTQCHSIYRIYCGYGRPRRDEWPNPANSSSDELFLQQVHTLRLLIERIYPLKEDTIFMNEFQMIPEVLYHIPDANTYASTYERTDPRLCGIRTFKVMPDMAELELQMINHARNGTIYGVPKFYSDMNAISPTQVSLPDKYGLRRVLVSNFKDCYVLKKVDTNWAPFCEFFVKNNTNPINELEECWFVFLVYCGYPKAFYNETSCYSVRDYRLTAKH
uniref:Putative salivary lipocalin n=1 Tax=Ixodes ricinus TaxID=34613 RepID=A0A6B0VA93_IXORI